MANTLQTAIRRILLDQRMRQEQKVSAQSPTLPCKLGFDLYTDETVWGILFQIDQGSQLESIDTGGALGTESPAWNIPFTTTVGAGNT